jgi:hypothetical protein
MDGDMPATERVRDSKPRAAGNGRVQFAGSRPIRAATSDSESRTATEARLSRRGGTAQAGSIPARSTE